MPPLPRGRKAAARVRSEPLPSSALPLACEVALPPPPLPPLPRRCQSQKMEDLHLARESSGGTKKLFPEELRSSVILLGPRVLLLPKILWGGVRFPTVSAGRISDGGGGGLTDGGVRAGAGWA